jgi:hypothetical protein
VEVAVVEWEGVWDQEWAVVMEVVVWGEVWEWEIQIIQHFNKLVNRHNKNHLSKHHYLIEM